MVTAAVLLPIGTLRMACYRIRSDPIRADP